MENQNNYEVQITQGFTGEFIVPFENDYIEIQYGFNVNNKPEGYEIDVNIHESFLWIHPDQNILFHKNQFKNILNRFRN